MMRENLRTLDEMVAGMHAHARHVLIDKGEEEILPFFHIQFTDRDDAIIQAPWSDEREKAAMVRAIRMSLKLFRPSIRNYAMISEAWTATYDHPPRPGDRMPSEREDRREVVVVSAGDHDGATMKVWEIIRDGKGRVTDLVEDKDPPTGMEGRMFNMLEDE